MSYCVGIPLSWAESQSSALALDTVLDWQGSDGDARACTGVLLMPYLHSLVHTAHAPSYTNNAGPVSTSWEC